MELARIIRNQSGRLMPSAEPWYSEQNHPTYPYWRILVSGSVVASADEPKGWFIEGDPQSPGPAVIASVPYEAFGEERDLDGSRGYVCELLHQYAEGWSGSVYRFFVPLLPPKIEVTRLWETQVRPQRPQRSLGIGIVTYNRLGALMKCVEAVERHTRTPFHLVIADDGSSDGSSAWARECGIPVVTGRNYGCAWNKNRALSYLLNETRCDPILLLEDDCWPEIDGWELPWIQAARRWGHVNYMTPFIESHFLLSGSGTVDDPYATSHVSGQCTVSTRSELEQVGYLDTRFGGWGEEHVEWTQRFWRLSRIKPPRWESGSSRMASTLTTLSTSPVYANLKHGLWLEYAGSYQDLSNQKKNLALRSTLEKDPLHRPAYRSDSQGQRLFREQNRALWPHVAEEAGSNIISVICPTKTPALAERLLSSMAGASCEIVWVWNGVGECPLPGKVVPYSDPIFRYEEAVNLGVMNSQGSVLLVVNDDVVFTCDVGQLFDQLLTLYRDAPNAGACYGRLEGDWQSLFAPQSPGFEGACWAIRRSAFYAMGGLEESLIEYGGDEIVTRSRMQRLRFAGFRLRGWTYEHSVHTTYGPDAFNLRHIRLAATALGWQGVPLNILSEDAPEVLSVLHSR